MQSSRDTPRWSLAGVLERRECWTLTLLGKLATVAMLAVAVLVAQRMIYSFLAVTDRVQGQVLVVEGWIPPYAVKEVASEVRDGHYRQVLVITGVYEAEGQDEYANAYVTRLLIHYEVPQQFVHATSYRVGERDRTYQSAVAVKQWLTEHIPGVRSIDVATVGPHARRSRLLYEKAFGPGVQVGVIALREKAYDSVHWWRSSEGIRDVPFEALAYLYARLIFSTAIPKGAI